MPVGEPSSPEEIAYWNEANAPKRTRMRACIIDDDDQLILDTKEPETYLYLRRVRPIVPVKYIKVLVHGIEVGHADDDGWTMYPMHRVLWVEQAGS